MLDDLEAGGRPPGVYTRWIDAASSRQLPSRLGKKPFAGGGDERSPSGEQVPPARARKMCEPESVDYASEGRRSLLQEHGSKNNVSQEVWTSGSTVLAKGGWGR